MGKLVCEGISKRCGANYGVHTFSVELRGRPQKDKVLCNSCRSTMETGGYTLTQLADVPEVRVVVVEVPRQAATIDSWFTRKDINGD